MIEQGGLAESGQFWEKWQGSAPAMPQFSTGCLAVDALLTIKALSMQKAGVEFQFESDCQLPAAHGYQRFLRGAGKFAGQCLDSGAKGPARANEGLCEAAVCPRV